VIQSFAPTLQFPYTFHINDPDGGNHRISGLDSYTAGLGLVPGTPAIELTLVFKTPATLSGLLNKQNINPDIQVDSLEIVLHVTLDGTITSNCTCHARTVLGIDVSSRVANAFTDALNSFLAGIKLKNGNTLAQTIEHVVDSTVRALMGFQSYEILIGYTAQGNSLVVSYFDRLVLGHPVPAAISGSEHAIPA
jgi:hypothetical protein